MAADIPVWAHLGSEWVCALTSSFLVAPAISIIDKSIVANAAGTKPLVQGLADGFKTLVMNPLKFAKQPSFLMIWGVYGGTYIVANSTETLCNRNAVPWYYPKFIASSTANVSLSVVKDKAFARLFGSGPPRPLPVPSYFLFATRDSLTVLASFNLPYLLSNKMVDDFAFNKATADTLAQLTVPCAIQFVSCPLHLLGLDLYNRQQALSASDRVSFIKREYFKTAFARIGRIFPAFGIGGVVNKKLRKESNAFLENRYALNNVV